ncbi:endo-1,4-beta-xylanase 3-like [Dendrobium catenatum]|uniref:endo-1,4-beta-xylanase 3-like n=1 Tax=Dendrobium catenatum TaxID=906689 RepID=UPI0010A00365|nr:endo-1,4-beta-xylanase 3-like [Dendrobium catenatum]
MKRLCSVLCLRRRLRKSKQTTHISSEPKSTSESMPEPQSSSGYAEGCERRDVVVDSNVSHTTNIISNHDFSEGLHSWHANCCHAYVASKEFSLPNGPNGVVAYSGESHIVITNRTECWQGLEQDITGKLSIDTKYDVSVFVGVHGNLQGSCGVQATLRLENSDSGTSYLCAGRKSVTKESWEKLEGSFTLTSLPSRAIFYLEGPPPGVDILINSVIILPTSSEYYGEARRCIAAADGNIIRNSFFEDGLNNWSGRGCKILVHESIGDGKILPLHGRHFASTSSRSQSWNGIQQDITGRVIRKFTYEVIAVVRIFGNANSAEVMASLWVKGVNGREQYTSIGKIQASDKDWSNLQGKFILNVHTSDVVIYLEGPPLGTDILINSLVVKRAEKPPRSPLLTFENIPFGVNIIENSNLNKGLSKWSPLGSCTLSMSIGCPRVPPPSAKDSIGHHEPPSGCYIVTTNRTETWMGPSQIITDKLVLHVTYQVAAWVRVGTGTKSPQIINLALGVDDRWVNGGHVEVTDDRWNEIVGSFRLEKQPSKVIVYVQGPSMGVDLMVAGLHIFPVDRKARFDNLKQKTDKVRKRDIILKFPVIDAGNASKTIVKVRQLQNSFPFGSCISRSSIENEELVDFFVKNFNWAVFGNELKWYHTEPEQGRYNYRDADEMLDFCKKHGMYTRGHCIFWEVEDAVQHWVKCLDKNDLMRAVQNRLRSLLSRYKGKFRHYDVNNEMLHGSFYKDRLGENIRIYMFEEARKLDPSATLFVNDYNVEDGCDAKASPEMFIHHILDLQEHGAPVDGIGLQGHINNPVGQIVCAALDKLAILGLPIWFTELDVAASNEHVRAEDLEVMLREAYAHPAVEGIMLWGFWELMCRDNSHLVDAEGDINEAGKRYLALKQEWLTHADGLVDDSGEFKFRGYHGSYSLEVTTPAKRSSHSFVVEKGESPLVLHIKS